GPVLPEP
ncbi:hypothetical protein BN1723_020202, partial [Verticillium longisporum]